MNVPKLVDAMEKLVADEQPTLNEVYILTTEDGFETLRQTGETRGWSDLPGITVKYVCA